MFNRRDEMTNPIPRSPLFATPANLEALDAYIQRLPKKEQAAAYTVMTMSLNLAHQMVAEAAKGE
jgi:hypothetical protein